MTLLEAGTSHRQIERVTGIDRKTIRTYAKRIEELKANPPGVATGTPGQTPPPRPPAQAKLTTSNCEPHRAFIEAQLRFKRNYMAIYQDLVDQHGFAAPITASNALRAACANTNPNNLTVWNLPPAKKPKSITARAHSPVLLARRAFASHACL